MTRPRCETCRKPKAARGDWMRQRERPGDRALCWKEPRCNDAPPRVLVREWWELWWIKGDEREPLVGVGGRELRFALLADAREYVALRANQYYRIKRVRRYRVAR